MPPMVMAPIAVMMPLRPEVEAKARGVVVATITVSRAAQMTATPVAPVPYLFNDRILTGNRLEVPGQARRRRSLSRHR